MGRLVTQAQYARMRGVSRAAVTKAVRTGRVELLDGKIDPRAADRSWRSSTDPAKIRGRARAAPAVAEAARSGKTSQNGNGHDPAGGLDYIEMRAKHEHWKSELARMQAEELSGKIIRVEDLKASAYQAARLARIHLQGIPNRLAPILATIDNAAEINQLLREEINKALETLARALSVADS